MQENVIPFHLVTPFLVSLFTFHSWLWDCKEEVDPHPFTPSHSIPLCRDSGLIRTPHPHPQVGSRDGRERIIVFLVISLYHGFNLLDNYNPEVLISYNKGLLLYIFILIIYGV